MQRAGSQLAVGSAALLGRETGSAEPPGAPDFRLPLGPRDLPVVHGTVYWGPSSPTTSAVTVLLACVGSALRSAPSQNASASTLHLRLRGRMVEVGERQPHQHSP